MHWAKRKRGVALIWTALMMVVLAAFVGLAVDFALMVWTGQQLQIVADASALAGAGQVRVGDLEARNAARNAALANTAGNRAIDLHLNAANAADGDIVLGFFDRDDHTFDPAGFPNAVQVRAKLSDDSLNGRLGLHFARVMGFNDVEMGREAIAILGGGTGTGMLILDSADECALTIRGNPTLELNGGAIQVNSTNPCSTCIQGDPVIEADALNMVGDACLTGVNEEDVPPMYPGSDPIPDPLEDLPAPVWDPADDLGAIDAAGSYGPGYYSGGIDLTGGTVTLDPGIYIVESQMFIKGNTNFYAEEVMFYINEGPIDIGGTGELTITPMEGGPYADIAMFQSRTNTSEGTVIGTSDMNLEGTYYFPQNKVNLGGTANQFGDQFIAWQAELFGNGIIDLAVDGSIPAPGRRVFLVR